MAKKNETGNFSNIVRDYNIARLGMDMDSSAAQIAKGKLSYALNAVVENFDASSINYQNEPGNIHCLEFPQDYILIGRYFINEQSKHIFFLTNPITGNSQIGQMINNDCEYRVIISDPCLGFDVNFPIHKVVHRTSNCSTEIFWADNISRRYLDLDNIPYKVAEDSDPCDPTYTEEVDCNQLKVQPNFLVPQLLVQDVITGGDLLSGTCQFAIQYSDESGNPLTAYYSITNPCPINDPATVSVNFNTPVGKAVVVGISNLDLTGKFKYYNLAVIKTVNAIASVELVGTYSITGDTEELTYTGQNKSLIRLSIDDIFEKFPYYELADDLTTARDVLIWKGLTAIDRVNYQSIASKITLEWETYKVPATESYADELNATNLRGYLRDEIYAFEIVFLLANGKQTDGFHIPGRLMTEAEGNLPDIPSESDDFIGEPDYVVDDIGYSPYWKIYNTASVTASTGGTSGADYKGPYQRGQMAFWESSEEYPCNQNVWGDLAGQKIRHHKFPDVAISPITQSSEYISEDTMVMEDSAFFPLGVRLDMVSIRQIIADSELTDTQKEEIAGFKIIRGNRGTNKSVIAKGILRNVGKYSRDGQEYYFPNYPYNDVSEDPFLNGVNNAWAQECNHYTVQVDNFGGQMDATVQIVGCDNNKVQEITLATVGLHDICSVGFPVLLGPAVGEVKLGSYEIWQVGSHGVFCSGWRVEWINASGEVKQKWIGNGSDYDIEVYPGTEPACYSGCDNCGREISDGPVDYVTSTFDCGQETPFEPIEDTEPFRQVFNSPETSFGQPFLGTVLKIENVMYGRGKGHFVEVKNNAKYKLLTAEAQRDALESSERIGNMTDPYSPTALFAAYQAYLEIYINGITRKNYAYSYNSIASYNYNALVSEGFGFKQRNLDIARYLIPGVQSVGEPISINNYNRESSVFLKTDENKSPLPFPKDTPNLPSGLEESSRLTIESSGNCSTPAKEEDLSVVSYYASMKNPIINQWGQVYSYTTVDTGFQATLSSTEDSYTVFGGDTFINKFAFKTKLPFFIDNKVDGVDDADIFYDEIGNIAYPKFWHSARSILEDVVVDGAGTLGNFISYKAHNFDCPNSQELAEDPTDPDETLPPSSNPNRTYYDGIFYMFSYGIPSFYCESSYNTDLRQAFNNKEGEYWPHVSTDIPDEWVQETNVSIANDNTYYYNTTYSKQNTENGFTNLPPDWSEKMCYTHFPFRAIYSDVRSDDQDSNTNNWLIYRAVSYFDFPQNYGKFVSIDGIKDKAVLARFENKTLLYNNLLTIDTSNPQAAYIGNDKLFSQAPPIDFADTDLGFVGTQNKFLLKIPSGQVTIDAKRGHIFLLNGSNLEVISKYGSGVNSFLKDNLSFKLQEYFPDTYEKIDGETVTIPGIDVDNHFIGVGIHGVYDNRYERIIITKLDYVPIVDGITLDPYTQQFKLNDEVISLGNPEYFCNKSWTLSFNLNTKSWISFHSYIPNYYIAENNHFYSGKNEDTADLWAHLLDTTKYNNFYGTIEPYMIEYPFSYQYQDQILQNVEEYNKVYKYFPSELNVPDRNNKVEVDDVWFNKAILYNGQQCSGTLALNPKPQNNMKEYMSYPKYNEDSKSVIWTKSDNLYQYNTFWDVIKDKSQPTFLTSCEGMYIDKILNEENMVYTNMAHNKAPLRAKSLRIRHILDDRDDVNIVTQFIVTPTQKSYK